MVTSSILEYINSAKKSGLNDYQIKQNLISAGWPKEDIDNAIQSKESGHSEVKIHSKLWIIPLIVIIILAASVAAYVYMFKSVEKQPDISLLSLDIVIPKSTYEVGEKLGGEYYMKYNGPSFEGVVLYINSKTNFEKKYFSKTRGMIRDIDFSNPEKTGMLKVALQAFRYNENGYSCCLDSFVEEGIYNFEMVVYDCSTIEKELGKACKDAEENELLNVQKLKSKSKSVVVSGGSIVGCKTSDDCTKICEGCKKGKQVCEQGKGACMDCFMDLQCNEGYKCEENQCILI